MPASQPALPALSAEDGAMRTLMLREALQSLAAPRVAKGILRDALDAAGLRSVPVQGPLLRQFINHQLLPAADQALGSDAREHLARVLAQVLPRSHPAPVLRRRPSSVDPNRDTTPVESTGRKRPGTRKLKPKAAKKDRRRTMDIAGGKTALVSPKLPAVRDGNVLGRLDLSRRNRTTDAEAAPARRWLFLSVGEEHIEEFRRSAPPCTVVQDAVALLQALDHCDGAPMLIVDCHFPAVHTATLASLTAELPPNSDIVLWGASVDDAKEAQLFSEAKHQWRTLPSMMNAQEVVRVLRFGERRKA